MSILFNASLTGYRSIFQALLHKELGLNGKIMSKSFQLGLFLPALSATHCNTQSYACPPRSSGGTTYTGSGSTAFDTHSDNNRVYKYIQTKTNISEAAN